MKHAYISRRALLCALALGIGGATASSQKREIKSTGATPKAPTAQASNVKVTGPLTLEAKAATTARVGYFPVQVPLSAEKPAGIVKEPAYKGTPKYATIHLGNGPKSAYLIAVDEPATGDYKIYLDKNQNGDLTDDGDGAWSKKNENNGRVMYGLNEYTLRASWGSPARETSSGDYGVAFYRFVGQDFLLMYRQAGRVGTVSVDGKTHKALLVENDADALYSKPLDDSGKPVAGKGTRPVWLLLDLKDDGKYTRDEIIDARAPFKIGEKAYEAKIAQDGSKLQLLPTTRKVAEKPAAPKEMPLLKAGVQAPDFMATGLDGGTVRLADLRGKVVVLDFWATWCGPCMKSMPHIEHVYQQVKDKGVAVLALCVFDEKAAFDAWVPKNHDKYTFPLAFDPGARDQSKSIAAKLYNVSGIPTTYIIDKDGKVAEAIVGYDDGDVRVEAALNRLGITTVAALH